MRDTKKLNSKKAKEVDYSEQEIKIEVEKLNYEPTNIKIKLMGRVQECEVFFQFAQARELWEKLERVVYEQEL